MSVPESEYTRPHRSYDLVRENGRTRIKIACPFCGEVVTAYLWSLAGGGKRCPGCGALHGHQGFTEAPNKELKRRRSERSAVSAL